MAGDNAQFTDVKSAVTEGVSTREQGIVKMWLAAIDAADKEERDWRKEADEIVAIYRSAHEQKKQTAFNILYSNTETLLPAVYNSTPQPDIRRRYNDPGVSAKAVADILERAISYSLDQYDFDDVVRCVVFDAVTAGRGIARIRYIPKVVGPDPSEAEEGEQAESDRQEGLEHKDVPVEPGEQIVSQSVQLEYVPWKNVRRGPGLVYDDVPWWAFKHYLTRDQLVDLVGPLGEQVKMDYDVRTGETDKENDHDGARDPSEVFLRCCVWEIWDRVTGQVLWIAPGYIEKPLRTDDDPLKLTGFFPVPRPLQPVETPGDLIPVPVYRSYKELAEELNEVTIRIRRLVRQIRVRGIYASSAADIEQIIKADDGELVPAQGLEMFAEGGLEKAIAWWPIDPQVAALKELIVHRETIKNTIYEVSGLSDILRGSTQASETATAQNIKAQWGSLRIQKFQADVQRFVRDVFRMKAELISQNFDMGLLMQMTGVQCATQADKQLAQQAAMQAQQMQQQPPEQVQKVLEAPLAEEVEQIMRSDLFRSYKIDVESDSTVRADLTRNQENMVNFVQGTAGYIQAVGPAVQAGLMPPDLALTIFGAFARNFRLGRQVDIALEKANEAAQEMAKQPKPEQPNPEVLKAENEAKANEQKLQLEAKKLEMQAQMEAAKLQIEQQAAEQKMMFEQQRFEQESAIKAQMAEQDFALKREMADRDHMMKREVADREFGMKADLAEREFGLKAATTDADMQLKREQLQTGSQMQRKEMVLKYGKKAVEEGADDIEVEDNDPFAEALKPLAEAVQTMAETQATSMEQIAKALNMLGAPKRVVRDPRTNQIVGTEAVN